MKKLILFFLSVCLSYGIKAQLYKKISAEINYGIGLNYFVIDYNEGGVNSSEINLLKKNKLGSITGFDIKYHLNKKNKIIAGFSKSINKGVKSLYKRINNVDIIIKDFKISHTNNYFQLGLEKRISSNKNIFDGQVGLFIINSEQQEISLDGFSDIVIFKERNFKNSNLQEGGIFGGIKFERKIDSKFYIGFKSNIYFLLSTGTLEAISFTPTLSYHFN